MSNEWGRSGPTNQASRADEAGSWRASSRECTPLNLNPRSSPLSAEPPLVKMDRNIYRNAKPREDPLIKQRVDQKKDDPKHVPKHVASNDHGHSRKNWTEKEIKTIRANLYKLASRRYEDLASELGFEESVLRDGVAKYFELDEENQSKDAKNVYEKEQRKKLLGKEIEEKKR
uniref:Uncharacterized protein n=1 Tax=Tanacetum cinerariifolium TaxID=118510 RepID=A0A6L2L5U8_TANCI|nr:hypothetical protein [Tanacetum cinerariifolium]